MAIATWADITRIQIGATASDHMIVTEAQVDAFAELSLDNNPLHMDDRVAQEYGFPRRVAHGMLALSLISRLIGTRLPGPGSLWLSQDVQFVAPVLVDDRLEAHVTVQQISLAAGAVVLRTEVCNTDTGAVVLRGTARVRILPRPGVGDQKAVSRKQ
jgi:3-hydroxybutyryl-CoA dehydratase